MEEKNTIENFNDNKQPKLLKVLSILSIIWIGFSILSTISRLIIGKLPKDVMIQQKLGVLKSVEQFKILGYDGIAADFQKSIPMNESINTSVFIYPFFTLIALIIGLVGVLFMKRKKKLGFHFYIIYSLLIVIQPYFFMSPQIIPNIFIFFNLLIAGLFVFLYSRNLSWMK